MNELIISAIAYGVITVGTVQILTNMLAVLLP